MLRGLRKDPVPVMQKEAMAWENNNASTPEHTQKAGDDSINVSSVIEPFGAIPVSSQVTANITNLLVSDGSVVRKGQVLCILDDSELRRQIDSAQLDLVKANETLRNATRKRDMSSQDKLLTLARAQQDLTAAQTKQPLELQHAQDTLAQTQREQSDFTVSQPLELRSAQDTLARLQQELADYEMLRQAKAVAADEVRKKREAVEDAQRALNLLRISQEAAIRKKREAVEDARHAFTFLQTSQEAKIKALEKAVEQARLDINDESVTGEDIQAYQLAIQNTQEELAECQRRLTDTRIIAPSSGTVRIISRTKTADMTAAGESAEKLGPGVRVYEGDPFLEISSAQACCRIEVDETDIARLRLGMKATISGDAFPGKVLDGKIVAIQTSAHNAAQGISLFPITVEITSPLEEGIRMGMTADVAVQLTKSETQQRSTIMVDSHEPLICLRGIQKTYQMGKVSVDALRGIDLDIQNSEMVAIMGPSGSGKSTLLNILGLLDAPSMGSYRLGTEEVAKLTDRGRSQLRNTRIGFIFQGFNLLPRLTAMENVMLPLVYSTVRKQEHRLRAESALEIVGLKERMGHHPNELSGGEQQRIAIARSLMNDPSLILADEPTGNLDSKSSAAIIDLIKQLNGTRGLTVVMITHDPNVAVRAERIIRLLDGRVEDDIATSVAQYH